MKKINLIYLPLGSVLAIFIILMSGQMPGIGSYLWFGGCSLIYAVYETYYKYKEVKNERRINK